MEIRCNPETRDKEIRELFLEVKKRIEEEPKLFEMSSYDQKGTCGTVHCIGGWANALLHKKESSMSIGMEHWVTWGAYFDVPIPVQDEIEFTKTWPKAFLDSFSTLDEREMAISAILDLDGTGHCFSNSVFDSFYTKEERSRIACARIDWFLDNEEWKA